METKLIDMANAPDPVVENCDAYLTQADTGVIEINGDGWGIDYKQAEKMSHALDVILREWDTLEYEMESHNHQRMQADEDDMYRAQYDDDPNPYHGTYSEL